MTSEFLDLQCHVLIVGDRPICLWDEDIRDKNLRFLHSIDPDYFNYLGRLYINTLEEEDSTSRNAQYAAIALRTAYSQALETLFALIFAAIQAPECVPAWMTTYKNKDLYELVRRVKNQQPIASTLEAETLSWSTIYDYFVPNLNIEDEDYKAAIKNGFTKSWSRFANDFLEGGSDREYNSIKHGLRVSPGGFKLKIGLIEQPGEHPLEEKMFELSASDFGSSYFNAQKIGDWPHHILLKGELRNWNIEGLAWGLDMATTSIKNVQSFLKKINGGIPEAGFICPEDLSGFDGWRGFTTINEPERTILPEFIQPLTREEIRSYYVTGKYSGQKRIIFTGEEAE